MSLKNLLALQAKKGTANAASPLAQTTRNEDAASPPTESGADETDVESVSLDEASAPTPESEVAEAAPVRKAGLGLNLVGAGRAVGKPVPPRTPANLGKRPSGDAANLPDSGADDGAVFSLEDLAGFDANADTAPARSASSLVGSGFDDEIEATAPDRVLPADITQQQLQFVESLDGIYPVLHDPELFGQAVRIIMLEMQDNIEYKKLLSDQDVHTMIRGMRNTMGMASVRKQEKSRKTGAAGKKSARGKSAVSDEDMALLDSLMGN